MILSVSIWDTFTEKCFAGDSNNISAKEVGNFSVPPSLVLRVAVDASWGDFDWTRPTKSGRRQRLGLRRRVPVAVCSEQTAPGTRVPGDHRQGTLWAESKSTANKEEKLPSGELRPRRCRIAINIQTRLHAQNVWACTQGYIPHERVMQSVGMAHGLTKAPLFRTRSGRRSTIQSHLRRRCLLPTRITDRDLSGMSHGRERERIAVP